MLECGGFPCRSGCMADVTLLIRSDMGGVLACRIDSVMTRSTSACGI